jgi:hypothetical protein
MYHFVSCPNCVGISLPLLLDKEPVIWPHPIRDNGGLGMSIFGWELIFSYVHCRRIYFKNRLNLFMTLLPNYYLYLGWKFEWKAFIFSSLVPTLSNDQKFFINVCLFLVCSGHGLGQEKTNEFWWRLHVIRQMWTSWP